MSLCPAFYCRRCERSHADECSPATAATPAPVVISGLHDWEKLAQVDLTQRRICRKCFLTHRETLLSMFMGNQSPPPVDGCPGKPI
jgi:hypothetical protein